MRFAVLQVHGTGHVSEMESGMIQGFILLRA